MLRYEYKRLAVVLSENCDSRCEKDRKCRAAEVTQGNLEIAKQTVDGTRKKEKVYAPYTRHARHKEHITRGHEIAILLKHSSQA